MNEFWKWDTLFSFFMGKEMRGILVMIVILLGQLLLLFFLRHKKFSGFLLRMFFCAMFICVGNFGLKRFGVHVGFNEITFLVSTFLGVPGVLVLFLLQFF